MIELLQAILEHGNPPQINVQHAAHQAVLSRSGTAGVLASDKDPAVQAAARDLAAAIDSHACEACRPLAGPDPPPHTTHNDRPQAHTQALPELGDIALPAKRAALATEQQAFSEPDDQASHMLPTVPGTPATRPNTADTAGLPRRRGENGVPARPAVMSPPVVQSPAELIRFRLRRRPAVVLGRFGGEAFCHRTSSERTRAFRRGGIASLGCSDLNCAYGSALLALAPCGPCLTRARIES